MQPPERPTGYLDTPVPIFASCLADVFARRRALAFPPNGTSRLWTDIDVEEIFEEAELLACSLMDHARSKYPGLWLGGPHESIDEEVTDGQEGSEEGQAAVVG